MIPDETTQRLNDIGKWLTGRLGYQQYRFQYDIMRDLYLFRLEGSGLDRPDVKLSVTAEALEACNPAILAGQMAMSVFDIIDSLPSKGGDDE